MISFSTASGFRRGALGLLLSAGAVASTGRAEFQPSAYYVDYQVALPFDIVTAHPRAIVHPNSDLDVAAAHLAGTDVYAYISVGELGANAPHRNEALALGLPLRGTNPIWNSDLVDFRDGQWEAYLVDTLARRIVEQGYAGFFLDTFDSINLADSTEETEAQRTGLLSMLRRLHSTYPEAAVVTNRGFKTIPFVYDQLTGLLVESVYRGYDFENRAYVSITPAETLFLEGHMNAARDAGLEVFVLDYVDPSQPDLAIETAQKILDAGYHALVTTPPLTGVTLGPWLPEAPMVLGHPSDTLVRPGQRVAWVTEVSGAPTPTIAWLKDGVIVPDATGQTLIFDSASESDSGSYQLSLVNRFGTVRSDPIMLTVDPNAKPASLTNLSARVWSARSAAPIIPGVVTDGEVTLLARAVGPGLQGLGVRAPLADPDLAVVQGNQAVLSNDDWSLDTMRDLLADTATLIGAFPLAVGSRDAALRFDLQGLATLPVGNAGDSGTVLFEVYAVPDETKTGRLTNLSLRADTDLDSGPLIVGFVLAGEVSGEVLVRAVGPGLASYGVVAPMSNPTVQLFRGNESLASNQRWQEGAQSTEALNAVFASVGAFELPLDSNDAALLVELPPGVYTAHVGDAAGGVGTVLVELYIRLRD